MLLHKLVSCIGHAPTQLPHPVSPNSGNCKITESSIHLPPMVLDVATKMHPGGRRMRPLRRSGGCGVLCQEPKLL